MFREESKEVTTLEKRIKGKRRGRNGLRFGLFKHGGRKNHGSTVEKIRIKFWRCIAVYMNNGKCLSAIFFHIHCESFWDFDSTIFVQTEFSGHIIPLTDGDFISNVIGGIIGRVKRFH